MKLSKKKTLSSKPITKTSASTFTKPSKSQANKKCANSKGFAPAWEQALSQAEQDREDAEGGFKKLVKKVIPSIGQSPSSNSKDIKIVDAETTDDSL